MNLAADYAKWAKYLPLNQCGLETGCADCLQTSGATPRVKSGVKLPKRQGTVRMGKWENRFWEAATNVSNLFFKSSLLSFPITNLIVFTLCYTSPRSSLAVAQGLGVFAALEPSAPYFRLHTELVLFRLFYMGVLYELSFEGSATLLKCSFKTTLHVKVTAVLKLSVFYNFFTLHFLFLKKTKFAFYLC